MSSLAPRWAFNVQAIHSAGDPHLAPGVHLRILPSALLGLPVAPFFVYRHGLGPGGNKAQLRTDVAWTDPLGVPLTPPFTVTPTRPATGWLPPAASGVCCWIALNASGVRSEIVVGTPRGPAAVAASKTAPYPLGASRIEQVVVSGKTGQVSGASWIDARPFTPGDGPFRVLPLPPPGGARYSGPPDAADQAKKRVRDGAPLKFGLHDDPTVSGPATAAAATADDEEKRVFALVPEVEDWVKNLIDDTTGEPWLLARTAAVRDQVLDRDIGQAQINYLGSVLNASLDPGVGRWLGFVDVDREPPGNTPGDVVGYVVRSFWQLNEKRLGLLPLTLPAGAIIPDVAALNPILARLCPKCKPLPKTLPGPFLDLWTMACTSIGQPPESPSAPGVGPAELGPWMPLVPPAAEREIVLPVSELVPGAALALARQKGTTFTGLNAHSSAKRALPIVPALPNEATSTGAGELADRGAPPEATNYRVAQADWFGRWSPFATRAAGAGVRPLPPRPAVSATYLQATGQIRVRVPLPPTDTLAHGSRLLAALEVKLDLGATQPLTSTPVPAGEPPEVEVLLAGPALGVAQTAVVPVTARWVDTAGQKSPESEVVVVQLADPRPPPAPAFAQPFLYTSRPDVTGRARVDLAWTPAVTHAGSRVFYTDETRLTGRLAALGSQGAPILAAVNTAPDVAARAQVFTDHADLFTRDLFEQLTPQPIRPATGTTQARFQHAVSGSLRILSFYRVVAVSAANIEVPFGSSPLLAVAVPNTAPPSQPLLSAEPLADGPTSSPFRARLKVRMPRGQVPAAEYRLRRTLGSATDLLAMPVVGTGTLPPPNGEPQEVVVFDAGGSEIDPAGAIQPWLTYSWRVEVRGAAEPGGPSGRWGTPSVPASATFVPPGPPEEAVNVTATRLSDGSAEVLWEHPSPLTGGPAGPYRLDVYRQRPGKREERAASISADAGPTAGGRNPDRTGPFHYLDPADQSPAGTCYRVIVLDPIGRPSRPSATATV